VRSAWARHPGLAAATAGAIAGVGAFGAIRGARLTIPYLVIVVGLCALVVRADTRTHFATPTLVGLATWGTLHLLGGLVELDDGRILYNTLVTRWIHFDNVVHLIGFGSAGAAGYELLAPSLDPTTATRRTAWFVTCTAALAAGALNEVVEFAATHVLAATDVGGYENTGRDLVANLVGGVIAATWVASRRHGVTRTGTSPAARC
jgi:hypothetical protein